MPERGPSGRFLPRAPAPAPAADRAALAAAITRQRAAVEDCDRTKAALARAEQRRLAAAQARSRAETALAEARAGEGQTLVAALLADAEPGPSPVKEADAALAAAAEQYAALGSAEQALRAHLAETEREFGYAQRGLRDCAIAVLAASPAVHAVVDRLEAAMHELVAAGDQFLWLVRVGALVPVAGYGFDPTGTDLATRVRRLAGRLSEPPTGWRDLVAEVAGSWRVFADALDAVEADAAAVL